MVTLEKKPYAGELAVPLLLERPTTTSTDDRGQPVISWSPVKMVWAKVEMLSGTIADSARQLYGETTHRVTCRYDDAITKDRRFRLGTRYLHIGYVDDVELRGVYMVCMVRATSV